MTWLLYCAGATTGGMGHVVLTVDQVLRDGNVVSSPDGFGTTATRTSVSHSTVSINYLDESAKARSANFRMIFASPERMIVLPDSESHMIVSSFLWTKCRNVTDRWTDRRSDGRTDVGQTDLP